ncbi:hypothetical protein DFQ26_001791 [Actinomortierella ambigua]|nr:hypothetical protein DFQ26_001791 [Actinomortierella ambigua]
MAPKPTILVLGGVGFIGRNFVTYLVENDLAAEIRVVDKALPETAYLNKRFKDNFAKVEVMQGNLCSPASVEKCFTRADGSSFDYVINLAAETKFSQPKEVYQDRIVELSKLCGQEALKRNVKVFVQMSSGEVYEGSKSASKEDSKTKPWNDIAKYKLEADVALQELAQKGLNLVILRPAIVYGLGAVGGLTPRLICGRVYKKLDEKMKFLWTGDLRINTVHVEDVARAIFHTANWYISSGQSGAVIFNLADENDTNQEVVNTHISSIFGIETGFQGTATSTLAKLNMKGATEDINDKHLPPWSNLLKEQDIRSTPLTPYLDQELLYDNAVSIDGTKVTVTTGFKYEHPKLHEKSLRIIIGDFQQMGIWPRD